MCSLYGFRRFQSRPPIHGQSADNCKTPTCIPPHFPTVPLPNPHIQPSLAHADPKFAPFPIINQSLHPHSLRALQALSAAWQVASASRKASRSAVRRCRFTSNGATLTASSRTAMGSVAPTEVARPGAVARAADQRDASSGQLSTSVIASVQRGSNTSAFAASRTTARAAVTSVPDVAWLRELPPVFSARPAVPALSPVRMPCLRRRPPPFAWSDVLFRGRVTHARLGCSAASALFGTRVCTRSIMPCHHARPVTTTNRTIPRVPHFPFTLRCPMPQRSP